MYKSPFLPGKTKNEIRRMRFVSNGKIVDPPPMIWACFYEDCDRDATIEINSEANDNTWGWYCQAHAIATRLIEAPACAPAACGYPCTCGASPGHFGQERLCGGPKE